MQRLATRWGRGVQRTIAVRLALAALLFLMLMLSGDPAFAYDTGPRTPDRPVQAPDGAWVKAVDEYAASAPQPPMMLPPLKAVLIVGPIDGDDGSWTTAEKANMDLAAAELAAHGVTVYKFYTPNNDWDQIKAASLGAHFILYRGHGIYWSPMPSPIVGGFALKDKFASSDDIRKDLHPAQNSIVMLYACFSAGTAGNDTGSITSEEAQRRVAMYSHPFLDIGAAGYYADWFGDAFQKLLQYLFEGRTLGQAYESFYDFNGASVERYVHPDHPEAVMWLDKDFWDGKTQYNDAFVGRPGLRLSDLFNVISMEVEPGSVDYLATPGDAPRTFDVAVRSGGGVVLHWQASLAPANPGWVTLASASGVSGQPVRLTVTPGTRALGAYTAELRIVSDTPDVQNNSYTVPIRMQLASEVHAVWLPLLRQ